MYVCQSTVRMCGFEVGGGGGGGGNLKFKMCAVVECRAWDRTSEYTAVVSFLMVRTIDIVL